MKKNLLFSVFVILFISGISIGLLGRIICFRSNKNYQVLQPELFAPDPIETVLFDPDFGQIYVCYNDASYVNVYSENGTFLWAVSVPYLRNAYFILADNKLFVYRSGEAYLYDSKDGTFLDKNDPEALGLAYYDKNVERKEIAGSDNLSFDLFQVYRDAENGEKITIVARPWWYSVFLFEYNLLIAFIGAIGIGILLFRESVKKYRTILDQKLRRGEKQTVTHPKARKILRYFKVITVIDLVYAVLNMLAGIWLNGILCVGLIPLALHFIVSSIVLENTLDSLWLPPKEAEILGFWKGCKFGSIAIAFLSEAVAVAIAS